MVVAAQISRKCADFLTIGSPIARNPTLKPGLSRAGLVSMHQQTVKNRRFDERRRAAMPE
jgi:hypothetical protein